MKAQIVPSPPSSPPATIQITQPLPKAPPKGKSVIFLQCQLSACERYDAGVQAAAAALGWSSKIEVFNNAEPGAGLETAIAQHPDYIAITGIPPAAVKPQLAAAAAAHIPVISCADPDPAAPGEYTVQCGGTLEADASDIGRWIINDSGSKANVVAVTIPQFPVLTTETKWFETNFKSLCSGCTYDQLAVSVNDVASGAVPQKIVGYLQAHPNVDYVFLTFDDLELGLPQALRTAGLSGKVKITGAAGDKSIMQTIGSTNAAWTIAPDVYDGWVMLDAMARISEGDALSPSYLQEVFPYPDWVASSAASVSKYLGATGDDWYGPAGYQLQFEKLWKVGA
ncbi:MAG: substrate-binding domain-containing protein [Mycobacterium sp.]